MYKLILIFVEMGLYNFIAEHCDSCISVAHYKFVVFFLCFLMVA